MFDRALAALDLSPAEQPMLECLPALQQWGVRNLLLAHVIEFGYGHGAALARQQDYVDWLENCAGPIRATGLSVQVQIRASGVPADEILALAGGIGAGLIVIGSRGQNVLSKLFLGSVARAVIHKTTVPLLLEWIEPTAEATRARCEAVCTDTLRHIVFATDFSEHAAAAQQAVLELAPRARVVECIHVLAADEKAAPAQAAMARLLEPISALGSRAKGTVLRGKPSSEIARHAASEGASLIVVGKHGRNWVASTLIGSTAASLCEMAGRPVLMVPSRI
jgi:nucleotide-binding universal stress UspA family protein